MVEVKQTMRECSRLAFRGDKICFTSPEQDISKEWLRQANLLAYLFALHLGKSKSEYMDGLPEFPEKQSGYAGRLDVPAIVQPPQSNLTLLRILEILDIGIAARFQVTSITDWDFLDYKTPSVPYTTWLSDVLDSNADGLTSRYRSVNSVRAGMKPFERGATVYDGLAYYTINPSILKSCYLDLPGSNIYPKFAPGLSLWEGKPELNAFRVESVGDNCCSVVAGREIVLGS